MPSQAHPQKQVATFPAARARFPLAGQPDALTFVNAARDFDLVIFYFVRAGATQRNRSCRSVQRFFERDHDVRFHIAAALRRRLASAESAERRSSPAAAEKCFEEIAEAGTAEFKLDTAVVTAAPLIRSAAWLLRSPSGRRLESTGLVPIGAELIVFRPLLRIAQDFVGFVDLLELFLGGFFIFCDVGVIFARQLAKGAADLIVRRRFR